MSPAVGRNDPCPCGSGKKYKRCCAADSQIKSGLPPGADEPAPGWRHAHAIWPKSRKALTDHAVTWLGTERLAIGFEASPFMQIPEDARPDWFELLLTWQMYDWVPDGEHLTIAAHWLSTRSPKSVDVADLVRRALKQPLSFYEVRAIEPSRGALLGNLLTGDESFVVDRSLAETLPPWSVLFGRLIPLENLTIFDAVGPRVFSPDWAAAIVREADDLRGGIPWSAESSRRVATELLDLYVDAVLQDDEERARPPELRNSDGDRLVLCTERWRLLPGKRPEALARLGKLGLEATSDSASSTSFTWLRDDGDGASATVLGRVTVDAWTVVLETNSKKRRARMKPRLSKALLEIAVHIESTERGQKELLAQAAEQRNDAHAAALPARNEAEDAALRNYLAKHYAAWPDEALPALAGRTPREAIATPEGKAEVTSLIREMEHRAHGGPMAEAYDFDVLRRLLGIIR